MFPRLSHFLDFGVFLLRLMVLAGALGVVAGVLTQAAAFGLILVRPGAIQKKVFAVHTGFWVLEATGIALGLDAAPDKPDDRFQ